MQFELVYETETAKSLLKIFVTNGFTKRHLKLRARKFV